MSGILNSFTLGGRISNPTPGITRDGRPMMRFGLYTVSFRQEIFREKKSMGFKCVAFGGTVKYMEQMKAGDTVIIQGHLESTMVRIGDGGIKYWSTMLVVHNVARAFAWNEKVTPDEVDAFEHGVEVDSLENGEFNDCKEVEYYE
jgi:single-stranded DNA-binding protein